MNFEELDRFFGEINSLKHRERQGWKDKDVERPRDTIASHSYGAALIGWFLAEREDLDSDRMVKMLLVHDLVMARMDDLTPEDDEYSDKKSIERERLAQVLEQVPEDFREEARELIEELRDRETTLSRAAKDADRLDTLMQAVTYSEEASSPFIREFLEHARTDVESDSAREILHRVEEGLP